MTLTKINNHDPNKHKDNAFDTNLRLGTESWNKLNKKRIARKGHSIFLGVGGWQIFKILYLTKNCSEYLIFQ